MSPQQSSFTSVTMETLSPNAELAVSNPLPSSPEQADQLTEPEEASEENSVDKELEDISVVEGLTGKLDDIAQPMESGPAHLQVEATSLSTPGELVSLPKSGVEAINNGTMVTVSAKRVDAEEGDSPAQEEEAWPDIGGPSLPQTMVSMDQDLSSVLAPPLLGGGANVYDSPIVRSGVGGLVSEEGRLVSDVMPPAIDEVPPVAGTGGSQVSDELAALLANEEVPDQPTPPPQVDSLVNEDAPEFIMPSAEPTLDMPKLEESHDQSHDLSPSDVPDQSHDLLPPDAPNGVISDEQPSQVKGHTELTGTQEEMLEMMLFSTLLLCNHFSVANQMKDRVHRLLLLQLTYWLWLPSNKRKSSGYVVSKSS